MSVLEAMETLQTYTQTASQQFRDQLEIIDKIKEQRDPDGSGVFIVERQDKGIDRAQTFRPVARPLSTRMAIR